MHAQPHPYAQLFQFDFAQVINANQGLIILRQKEKGDIGIVSVFFFDCLSFQYNCVCICQLT